MSHTRLTPAEVIYFSNPFFKTQTETPHPSENSWWQCLAHIACEDYMKACRDKGIAYTDAFVISEVVEFIQTGVLKMSVTKKELPN